MGKLKKKTIAIFLIMFLIGINIFAFIAKKSFSADNENVILESNLEKYVNYSIQNKEGTLIQYNVKAGIEYKENYVPVRNTELTLNLNKIDGVFPDSVKVIANSTKVTNGKTDNITPDYTYDSTSGAVVIKASNENEKGEAISSNQTNQDDRDSYTVICNYNTYVSDKKERELTLDANFKAKLFTDDNREITGSTKVDNNVTENVGDIVSISVNADDVYNGIIKSNIVNKTETNTKYNENSQIMISKKDAMQNLKINLKDDLVNVSENNGEQQVKEIEEKPIYKTITFNKTNVENIFGEEASLEIYDNEENLLFTINKDTQYDENGNFTYTYEKELNEITIKTTAVANEGTLNIKHQNEIPGTMKNINGTNIRNMIQVDGLDAEENSLFTVNAQNLNEIKDTTTNVDLEMNQNTWTNEKQNELTFSVKLIANNEKYNMIKNPKVTIELPDEVEKVILGNSKLLFSDNFKLEDANVITNDKGKKCIVYDISGEQTEYPEDNSEIVPTINIEATIILKKGIESTESEINLIYLNQSNAGKVLDQATIQKNIKIENYQDKDEDEKNENNTNIDTKLEKIYENALKKEVAEQNLDETQKINGLNLEVKPVKGDTELKNGDIVYGGEYIKYKFKVTNTTGNEIQNVKVVGTIPEGTTYGELVARPLAEGENKECYEYNFDESIKQKEIVIGTMKPGEEYQGYYEVKVKDLQDIEEKAIQSNLEIKVGNIEGAKYSQENTIKKAEVKLFLQSFMGTARDGWYYQLVVDNPSGKEVNINLKLPQGYNFEYICGPGSGLKWTEDKYEVQDNIVSTKVTTSGTYIFGGMLERANLTEEGKNGKVELTAIATAKTDEAEYKSNENRIQYTYEDVDITMTSENEGEEVPHNSEITYSINIKNISKTITDDSAFNAVQVNLEDYLPEELINKKVHYENYNRIESDGTITYEKQEQEDNIANVTDENGVKLADVDLLLTIPYGKSVTVKITGTTDDVTEKTEIQNSATVSGVYIKSKTTNIIKHYIMPDKQNSDGTTTPDNPDTPNTPDNPNNPNNPTNPDNSNDSNGENGQDESNKIYSISGLAWLDANKDGQRQSSEKTLSGINVMLVDKADSLNVKDTTTTNQNGRYQFNNIKNGNYIVVFKYNTSLYNITKYQQAGVSSDTNSDAIANKVSINGESFEGGTTDTIKLNSSKENIDIGLIEKEQGNLKVEKYIDKVTVKTNKKEKVQSYENTQLAKTDIRAKEIKGSIVTAKYKIVVTNSGEAPTLVGTIVDNIPNGFEFNSSNNTNWKEKSENKIINTSLANKKIKAGESVEVSLNLIKSMDENSTGTFSNVAYLEGNENNSSKADLIISVSTGIVTYISIVLISILILGAIVYITRKYGIGKMAKMFSVMLVGTIILTVNAESTFAIDRGSSQNAQFRCYAMPGHTNPVVGTDGRNYLAYNYFQGIEAGDGRCINHGVNAAGGNVFQDPTTGRIYTTDASGTTRLENHGNYCTYTKVGSSWTRSKKSTNNTITDFNMKGNTEKAIGVKYLNGYYLYGPFIVQSDYNGNIDLTVKDKSGDVVNNYSISDSNGNNKTIKGSCDFYIKLSESSGRKGISYVKAHMKRSGKTITTITNYGEVIYEYDGAHQKVQTYNDYITGTDTKSNDISYEKNVVWTVFNSSLDIMKVDADDPSVKIDIEGTIQNKSGTWKQNFKTTNGVAHFDNLDSEQEYIVTETINKNYGYEGQVGQKINFIVHSGELYKVRFKNSSELGNLELNKQDATTGKKLENVGFKIKDSNGKYIIAIDEKNQKQSKVTGEISLGNMQTTKNKEEATEFVTDKNGICKIYRIRTGTYTVEETSVKDTDYGYDTDDDYVAWNVDGKSQNKGTKATVTVERQRSYNTRTKSSIINDDKKAIEDGVYEIETGTKSNFAVDVTSANAYDKANVAVYEKNKSIAQQFYLQYLGNGAYKIISMVANKCLDAYGGAKEGTNVEVYTDNNSEAQKWYLETTCSKGKAANGYYFVRAGQYYLDIYCGVQSTENYTNIRLWPANGSKAQQFKFNSLTEQAQAGNTVTKVTFNNTRKYIKLSGYVWEDMVSGKQSTRDNLYNDDSDKEKNDKLVANVKVRLKDKDGSYVKFKTEDGKMVDEILTDSNGSYRMVDVLIDKLKDYYVEFEYNGMSYQSVATDLYKANGSKATDANTREEFNNKYATISNNQSANKSGQKTYNLRYKSENHTSTLIYGDNPVYGYEGQNFPINNVDQQYIMRANTRDAYLADKNSQYKYTGYLTDRYSEETIRKQAVEEIDNINLGLYERERPDLALIEDVESARLTLNGYEHTYKYAQRFENTAETGDGFNVAVKFGNKYGSASYTRNIYSADVVYNKQPGNSGKLQAYVTYKIAIRNESTNLYAKVNSIANYYDSNYDVISVKDADNKALQYQVDQNYGTKNGYKRVIINTNENVENQKENYVYIEYKLNNSALNSVLNQKVTLNSVTEINSYSVYSDNKYTQSYAGIDQDSNPGSATPTDRNSYEDDTDSAPSFILDVQEGRVIKGTVWEDEAIDALLRKSGYEKERKGDGVYQKAKENVVKNIQVELLQVGEDGKTTATSLYQFDKASKSENVKLAKEITATNGSYEFNGVIPGIYVIKYTYGDSSVIFDVKGKQIDTVKARYYKSTIYRNGKESNVGSDDGLWYREETGDKAPRWSDARDYTGIYKDGTTTDIVKLRTESRTLDNKDVIKDRELTNIEAKTEKFDIKMDYDVNKDNTSEYGADLKFVFDNIDFGIIKRPQQISTMEKTIKHLKVTLANGQVIIDGDPSKDNLQHVKLLPDGHIHIELDSELMQGANVELTYGITVDNRASEIDYNDKNYYIYGIIPSNRESTFRLSTVSKVFDYLSNDLVYDKNTSDKNKDWTEVTETPDELLSSGKIANERVRDALKKYNRIFQTDKFKDMKPGTTKTVEMVVTKVLANTQDDMTYDNDAEVIELENEPNKDTNSNESTPGNYVPTYGGSYAYENQGEGDDSYKEITVTVPTGENKNYIPYIIMGVSGFIILAAGVIFIKKKVL